MGRLRDMLLGYMRVSKADGSQVLDLQRDALLAAGVAPGDLYEDHASGKRDDRPGLAACLKALRKDDVLVAWKLDRLGRGLRHLVNLVHELTERRVGLKILSGRGATLDTTTPAGKHPGARLHLTDLVHAGLTGARHEGGNGR
jgi:DNA invertase Pin-like site-specific DNA recombinase